MRGFDNILVPIDFSDPSAKILNTALRAASDEGKLTLLHVVEYLPLVTESTFGVYPHRKDLEQIKNLSRRKLEAAARQHPDHAFELLVREGKPASAILESVAELGPDLVVMGTHGRSRLDHLLIGSVAERVVRKAPCNVLLVHVDPRE
ncbi:MAG: universal stress protein [Planctomycetota bacterium]|nr:universal stress protein [Planctomycetota bacterium]